MPSGSWHPDPRGFLDRRLRERRLSIQQFLAARPGQSWNHLVHYFDEPLAPIQLMAYVQEAAAKDQWLDWYTRDALARRLESTSQMGGGSEGGSRRDGLSDRAGAVGLERHHEHPRGGLW
jgi:hypothetical protein